MTSNKKKKVDELIVHTNWNKHKVMQWNIRI